MESLRVLLLDLDGTVREPASGAKFINKPEDQRIIEGVEQAIARYQDYKIIGITNQAGVAFGYKTLQEAIAEQQVTLSLAPWMKAIYFCPYKEGEDKGCFWVTHDGCSGEISQIPDSPIVGFRKPNPGMILRALFDEGADAEGILALYVGDRPEDEQAARSAGVPFMWADEWRTRALVS